MSDRQIILEVPEELLEQAESAQIDVHKTMIDALSLAVVRQKSILSQPITLGTGYPSDEQIGTAIRESLEVMSTGSLNLRKLGLNAGSMQMSNDFDAELPDEFWLGDDA